MYRKFITLVLSLFYITMFFLPLQASAENLGTCFVDSLNGKERKKLAKWMFFSMSTHPELQAYAQISPEEISASNTSVAALITRLFVEDCANEARAAQQTNPLAIKKAFELVGKVAMQELMNNQAVKTSITKYAQQVDREKIKGVFSE